MQKEEMKMEKGPETDADGAELSRLEWAEAMEDRLIDFAARVGTVVDALPETRMGRHIAGQMVRSGTSAAPNYAEGCAGESRADFVHKLAVVLKELRETRVWLKLSVRSKCLPSKRLTPLIIECKELMNIIGKSIVTAKSKRR